MVKVTGEHWPLFMNEKEVKQGGSQQIKVKILRTGNSDSINIQIYSGVE